MQVLVENGRKIDVRVSFEVDSTILHQ